MICAMSRSGRDPLRSGSLATAILGITIMVLAGPVAAATVKVEEIPVTTASAAARALFEEGQYLLDVGRGVEARQKFQAAVAEDPNFTYAHFNQSNAALSFREFQECMDRAAQTAEGKSEGERLLVEFNRTFLTNDTEEGVAIAQKLVERYPASPRAWITLAGAQNGRNDAVAARQSYAKARELDPHSAAAVFALGNNYLFSEPKDLSKAEATMREFIALYPKEAKAYEGLGDTLRGQKKLEEAAAAYTQATDIDPALAVAQLKKGHVYSFLGKVDEARAAYDAGIAATGPETRATYANYRAFTHIHGGDVQGSLDELAKLETDVAAMGTPADQVKGVQVFTLTNYATAALHAGKFEAAAWAISERNKLQMEIAADVGTDDARRLQEASCRTWDGLLAAYEGDAAGARQQAAAYAKLIEGDDNPRKMEPYHWVLGMVALKQGDFVGAVEHLRQADFANTMFIRYQLALAEQGAGHAAEAKRLFREVADWGFNTVGYALVRKDAARRASA